MNELNNEISRSNKIPGSIGCDSYTRPEEISILSKYLGEKRKNLEESIELNSSILGIPGKTTGNFPIIDNLPKDVDELSLSRDEVIKQLSNKLVSLDKSSQLTSEINLPTKVINLDSNKEPNLTDKIIGLDKSIDGIESLEDTIKTLDNGKQDIELSEKRVSLNDNSDIELGNKRVNLDNNSDIELSEKRIDIDNNSDIELSEKRIDIDNNSDIELGNKRVNLDNNSDIELGNKRIDIDDDSDIELGNKRIDIDNNSDIELSEKRIDIDNNSDIELGNKRIDIDDDSNIELGNKRIDIDDDSDIELSDFIDEIPSEIGEVNLPNTIKKLGNISSTEELSNKSIKLEKDSGDISLSSKVLSIENLSQEISLDDFLDILNIDDDTVLSETVKSLKGEHKNITSLNNKEVTLGTAVAPQNQKNYSYLPNKDIVLKEVVEDKLPEDHIKRLNSIDSLVDSDEEKKYKSYSYLDTNTTKPQELLEQAKSPENQKNYSYLPNKDIVLKKVVEDKDKLPKDRKEKTPSYLDTNTTKPQELLEQAESPENQDNYEYFDPKIEGNDLYGWDNDKIPIDKAKTVYTGENTPGLKQGDTIFIEEELIDLNYKTANIYNEDYHSSVINRVPQVSLKSPESPENQIGWVGNKDSLYEEEEVKTLVNGKGGKLKDYIKTIEGTSIYHSEISDDEDIPKDGEWEPGDEKAYRAFSIPHSTSGVNNLSYYGEDLHIPDDHIKNSKSTDSLVDSEEEKKYKSYSYLDTKTTKPQELLEQAESPENQDNYEYFDHSKLYSSTEGWYDKLSEFKRIFNIPEDHIKALMNEISIDSLVDVEKYKSYSYLDTNTTKPQELLEQAKSPQNQDNYSFEEFEKSLQEGEELPKPRRKMPKYRLPVTNSNPNTYLRWLAEEILSDQNIKGEERELLLRETLAMLIWARDEAEKLANAEKYRLPGNTGVISDIISGGIDTKNIIKSVGNALANAISTDIEKPVNRPEYNKESGNTKTLGWENINRIPTSSISKETQNKGKGFLGVLKDFTIGGNSSNRNYKFADNYLQGEGIKTTLLDLAAADISNVQTGTVEEFFELLKTSPYLTTASNITSTGNGYKVMTLDSNAHWEVILEPYAGALNGGYTFLPLIEEIELRNRRLHNVSTGYSRWIPISSFELQKEKMTTKSLGLFDGEITYPISIEFTNEFRLTIVDDQYKSWRTYFERCMKAAIYSSTPNILKSSNIGNYAITKKRVDPEKAMAYSMDEEIRELIITGEYNGETVANDSYKERVMSVIPEEWLKRDMIRIDKNYQLVAPYKNLSFRCRILVMTPQLSTITKYDLLLVLKDFSEERSGEIDPSGSDLTVSFSIVGENPPDGIAEGNIRSDIDRAKQAAEQKKQEDKKLNNRFNNLGSNLLKHGVSSAIGLI